MFGEINVYEAARTVHECEANGINRARLGPLVQGCDEASLPRPPPWQRPDTHTERRKQQCVPSPGQNSGHR